MADKTKLGWEDFSEENLLATDVEEEDETEQDPADTSEEKENEGEEKEIKPKKPAKKTVNKVKEEEKEDVDVDKEKKLPDATETEEKEEETGVDATTFFEEVEKLTGLELEVDYGDVDPLTPQGVAIREKAVKVATLDNFLEELKTNHPQAYRALEYAHNGGDVADLFSKTSGRDYTKIEITEGDETLAKEIIKEYYKSRGVKTDSRITKMIEADEESEEGIIKIGRTYLEELKGEQVENTNKVLQDQQQKAADQKKRDEVLVTAIEDVLTEKKLGTFRLADRGEAEEFKSFVVKNIRRTTDGKYELTTPLEANNLEKVLQYQYFQFKKGDLGKIVQQKVSTETAKILKLRLEQDQKKLKKSTEQEDKTRQSLSMKSFEIED